MKSIPKKIIVSFLAAMILFAPMIVSAGIVPCGAKNDDPATLSIREDQPCQFCHLFVGIKVLVDFLVKVAAVPLAVAIMIYGAVEMLIAGGSPTGVKKGQDALTQAVWGIIITFAAWLIIDTIIKALAVKNAGGTLGSIEGWGPWHSIPNCPGISF